MAHSMLDDRSSAVAFISAGTAPPPPPPIGADGVALESLSEGFEHPQIDSGTGLVEGEEPAVRMSPGPPPPPLTESVQPTVPEESSNSDSSPMPEHAGPSSALDDAATPQVTPAEFAQLYGVSTARATSFLSGHTLETNAVARAGWRPEMEADAHSSDDEVTRHAVNDEAASLTLTLTPNPTLTLTVTLTPTLTLIPTLTPTLTR